MIAFWQYNTAAERFTWNARFSWEFEPLSYVFIVFNDSRTFAQPRFETPFTQREGIIKFRISDNSKSLLFHHIYCILCFASSLFFFAHSLLLKV
jgi:hypothetical protein